MRIARLCEGEDVIGSVSIAGKMPRAITWSGSAYVRHGNSYKYRHVATVTASALLRSDFVLRGNEVHAKETERRIRRNYT